MTPHKKYQIKIFYFFLCLFSPFLTSCTTAWVPAGSYFKTVDTQVSVLSDQVGDVYMNNKYMGQTPLNASVEYEQEVQKKTRKVSYWNTQPALSLFLSILSLGLYIPFSLIPADIETTLEKTNFYRNNEFDIHLKTEGKEVWRDSHTFTGEEEVVFKQP